MTSFSGESVRNIPESLSLLACAYRYPFPNCFSFQVDAGTITDASTLTEPENLGPCEPGTSVSLEGIVWHETDSGTDQPDQPVRASEASPQNGTDTNP